MTNVINHIELGDLKLVEYYPKSAVISKQHFEENRRRAHFVKMEILRTFIDENSSQSSDRPAFYEMIDFIEHGKANCILVHELYSLARNPTDGIRILQLLESGKIKLIITNSVIWNQPMIDAFTWDHIANFSFQKVNSYTFEKVLL